MMKQTKRWLLWLSLSTCLLVSIQSFGQYPGGMSRGMGMGSPSMGGATPRAQIPNIAGDMANKEVKWLKDNISLDKEQAKAVKKLYNEYADQQQDAIKDIVGTSGQPTPETMKQIREVMLMLNEEKEDKLRPMLTPEQWSQYQSKKEDMQREIGGFRPPAKGTTTAPSSVTQ